MNEKRHIGFVIQENHIFQLENKIYSQNFNVSREAPNNQLLEDLRHNNSVLSNKVSQLQANDITLEEKLMVLEANQTNFMDSSSLSY